MKRWDFKTEFESMGFQEGDLGHGNGWAAWRDEERHEQTGL